MTKTAHEYREEAKTHETRAHESFERCDTDGFVSQWCSGLSAQLAKAKAELTENGKRAEFTGLYEGERRLKAKVVDGKFGCVWLLHEAEANRFGRKFIPMGRRSKVQKALGLHEAREMAPAWAAINGSGKGLSGLATARVVTYRTDRESWGTEAERLPEEK
jgi:hypothetical protein